MKNVLCRVLGLAALSAAGSVHASVIDVEIEGTFKPTFSAFGIGQGQTGTFDMAFSVDTSLTTVFPAGSTSPAFPADVMAITPAALQSFSAFFGDQFFGANNLVSHRVAGQVGTYSLLLGGDLNNGPVEAAFELQVPGNAVQFLPQCDGNNCTIGSHGHIVELAENALDGADITRVSITATPLPGSFWMLVGGLGVAGCGIGIARKSRPASELPQFA